MSWLINSVASRIFLSRVNFTEERELEWGMIKAERDERLDVGYIKTGM
jgi:hypothetical protein